MNIRILVKEKEMNILQMYAPQTGCSNEEKEFKEILKDNAGGECICIMGDFNAQIGKDSNGTSQRRQQKQRRGECTGHV
jgi:uncharacterized protein YqeY